MESQTQAPTVILRRREVERRTGMSRTTIYVRMARGDFPEPVSLGARSVGWIEAEVAQWIARRVAMSRAVAP